MKYRLNENTQKKYPNIDGYKKFFLEYPELQIVNIPQLEKIYDKIFIESEDRFLIFLISRKDCNSDVIKISKKDNDSFMIYYSKLNHNMIDVLMKKNLQFKESVSEDYVKGDTMILQV